MINSDIDSLCAGTPQESCVPLFKTYSVYTTLPVTFPVYDIMNVFSGKTVKSAFQCGWMTLYMNKLLVSTSQSSPPAGFGLIQTYSTSGIDLLIILLARKRISVFPKMSNFSFNHSEFRGKKQDV